MWPDMVEFRSASSAVADEKERRIRVKYKSADKYVDRPNNIIGEHNSLFSPPTRQFCLVSNCVHTADTDKTRQPCLVRVDGVNKL